MGPPGSGKGTQSSGLASALGVPAISTGAIFRDNLARRTELGIEAERYMSVGDLVPDELTDRLVEVRLAEPDAAPGFILDGYPRNMEQVKSLDAMLAKTGKSVDGAILLSIPDDQIVARLLHRAQIEGREDDTEPVIRERIGVYHSKTEPIVGEFERRGSLHRVDGMGSVEDVAVRLRAAADAAIA
jgi:adenylate kinase